MLTFFTCVLFKATLEETKLIYLCRTMWKSRTKVLKTFITLVLHMTAILFSELGLIAGAKDSNKGRQTVFFTAVDPMNEPQEKVRNWTKWKVSQITVFWINLKSAQDRGLAFWQTHFHAIILDNSVPADCLEK